MSQPTSSPTTLSTKLACGAIAGVIGTSIIFPIDTIKTRLQSQAHAYRGIIHCFKSILSTHGPRGFYRGLSPNLIGVTPEKAIKLAVNDTTRQYLADKSGIHPSQLSVIQGVLAGGFAGLCQVVATCPMEIVKIQMQVASTHSPGEVKPTAIGVLRKLGLRGLYKGTAATLLRDIPFSMVFFPSAAFMNQVLSGGKEKPSFGAVLLAGVSAGVFAAVCSTPADVIKTRLQIRPKDGVNVYTSIPQTFKHILVREGPTAFFKGAIPRAMVIGYYSGDL